MHILYIGLGKMGLNMVERMLEKGHSVTAYDPNEVTRTKAATHGAAVATSIEELMQSTPAPRNIWIMVPHQVVDTVLDELAPHLTTGDTILEGGNSPFRDTVRRAEEHMKRNIDFLDVGVSGGPGGARHGACMMVGGKSEVFERYADLFADLTVKDGSAYMGKRGSGHFVKMVHNGIEYGMMQAIAEGFDIMQRSEFDLTLTEVARLYNHGSVIESKLMGWLLSGFDTYGEDLAGITGSAHASGEGTWTVETAHELDVPVAVIEDALKARTKSQETPSFQGQLVSVMRNQFGGHSASDEK